MVTRKVTLICGPPCSGKTTLAHTIAEPDMEIVDLDEIARDLGSPSQWIHPQPWLDDADDEVNRRIDRIASDPIAQAVIVRGLPDPDLRARLAQYLDAEVTLLDPGKQECLLRAARDGRPSGTTRAINTWYWGARRAPRW